MATQPTQEAVPSESPRNLKFNAGKIDEFVTSASHVYTDRFGVQHWTIAGITYNANQAISRFGYITVDSFQAGATLTLPNQALRDALTGEYYRWDGVFPTGGLQIPAGSTPQSTGGIGPGAWLSVGDAVLRGQLAKSDGVNLVGGAAKEADLLAHESSSNPHPQMTAFITAEADRAETAANAAAVTAKVFESTASGISGTTSGEYFSVVSSTDANYLDLYRNVSGVATYQKSYPSTALVNQLNNASNKLTGSDGFAADGSDGPSTMELEGGQKEALVIGDFSGGILTVNTADRSIESPLLKPDVVQVMSSLNASDSQSADAEHTEDLIPSSSRAKVIGDGKWSLTYDTQKGELLSTFRIVDVSQNKGISLDNDVPDIITGVPAGYHLADRHYQATPTIARAGSRFWLAWRADKNVAAEAPGNFFVIGYSDDNGNSVTESHILKFSNDNHQIVDPMLWLNPESQELWLFWGSFGKAQAQDGICGCWCSVLENPKAKRGFSWSKPYKYRNIGDPRRPVRIAGKWMQCVDMWRSDAAFPPLYPETAGCEFVEFNPLTKTTVNIGHNTPNNPAGGGTYTGFFETELLQLTDGRLMSTTRGLTGTELTRSFSIDGGATWTAQAKYDVLGNVSSSRIWLGRTPSGRVLVAYNNDLVRRTLTLKLSEDDGETFPYSVVLEGADTPESVSYPIIAFGSDGDTIYTTYDYGRGTANEIRITLTKESEIVAGTAVPDINIISGPTA